MGAGPRGPKTAAAGICASTVQSYKHCLQLHKLIGLPAALLLLHFAVKASREESSRIHIQTMAVKAEYDMTVLSVLMVLNQHVLVMWSS